MNTGFIAENTNDLVALLLVFIGIFFAVAALGLAISIIRGKDTELAGSCRKAAFCATAIGLILMFFRFVLI